MSFSRLNHIITADGHISGTAKGRKDRLIDKAYHLLCKWLEHPDLPAADHGQRFDDHVPEFFIIIYRALFLVHDRERKAARACNLTFHKRQLCASVSQFLFQCVNPPGKGRADGYRRAVAASLFGVHGQEVGLVELGEGFRIIAGCIEIEAVLFPVDNGARHMFGKLDFHLLIQAQPGQLRPVRSSGQFGKDQVDGAPRIIKGHAADGGRQKLRFNDHL